MHAKTDSEVTSSEPSSPTRSPRPPVYYVQSPSRDSHDFEKTTNSLHSSPAGSPPRSNSSVGRHSRESSSTRFSGSLKSGSAVGSRKVSPNEVGGGGGGRGRKQKAWAKKCAVIEEEGLLEDESDEKGLPRRCYILFFVLAFVVLFSIFSLILWGASRSQKPQITMKSIRFEDFNIQAGTDASGVPTDMASMNATVTLTFRNTASFFGLHVSSTPVDLIYTQLRMASGNIKNFYQSRKSQRTLDVAVLGKRIPMYGGSSSFTGTSGSGGGKPPVPLRLRFTVRSRAYVLGKLVKPKFYIAVDCSVVMDQNKLGAPVYLKNSCHYN
ncbi:hypothetical protein Taro_011845 [Colocasia esculenta]|uniref:Late embryogenesis abundant protein LEA-2 subgroup domain-containing protein n=1 Tax=Colocasia esculenta TaxID=4460 RepID=A0A843U7B4_COLES|nr:hypothetical protein [Colocasia esculenta]